MRTLIRNEDLRKLTCGIAVAAASGLLMGLTMHPNLRGEDDAVGPQILMPGGGPRTAEYLPDRGVNAYRGQVPEYVIGTDWTRPQPQPQPQPQLVDAPVATEDEGEVMVFSGDADAPTVQRVRADWDDEPREPARYASRDGGVAYEANLPPPPEDPDDSDAG